VDIDTYCILFDSILDHVLNYWVGAGFLMIRFFGAGLVAFFCLMASLCSLMKLWSSSMSYGEGLLSLSASMSSSSSIRDFRLSSNSLSVSLASDLSSFRSHASNDSISLDTGRVNWGRRSIFYGRGYGAKSVEKIEEGYGGVEG
jgi:hypothetical protein